MIALEVQYRSTSNLQALASSVPIGQRGLVHVWGRNDTPVTQDLGISWVVRDPDGVVVEEYSDWSYGHGPGDDHEFIGGRFDLDKEGTYTLKVDLLMGTPDNPVIVDSYQGDLCTTTTEVPPEYAEIQHTVYPLAYIYEGWQETCIFEFPLGPEQIPFTQWGGIKIAEAMASHVEDQGSRVLELKIYEDTTPLLWTNYRVEVTAAITPQEGIAIWPVLAALPWAAIIKGSLIVIGIVIVGWVIENLITAIDQAFFNKKPGLEEVKPAWSRETLNKTINDTEDYLDRPLTPIETLEEMSDEELRVYLDQLGEEVAPPKEISPWAIVALVGGVGVLGVGAAVAFAMAKPTE